MKPRHARQVRAGIQAARDARPGDYTPILALKASGVEAFIRTLDKEATRRWKAAPAAVRAAETFTHPTTPTAADKAAGDGAHTQKEQM